MCPTCPAGGMVAEKKCLHFRGQIATQVAKYVSEPILAPESRFRGIRWGGNLHHFLKSICCDWSWGVLGGLTPLSWHARGCCEGVKSPRPIGVVLLRRGLTPPRPKTLVLLRGS